VGLTKEETLRQTIIDLAVALKKLSPADGAAWEAQVARIREKGGSDLTGAWEAAKRALQSLPAPRCNKLFVGEVAVLFERTYRQTNDVLTDEFQTSPLHKKGVDYKFVSETRMRENPNTHKFEERNQNVWVYRRDAVEPWWQTYLDRVGRSRAEIAKKAAAGKTAERLSKERERLAERMAVIDRKLAAIPSVCAFMALTTRASLAGVTSDRHPFIMQANGAIVDHAQLPSCDTDTIAAALTEGAYIDTLTLQQALRRAWVDMDRWQVWRIVWDHAVDHARIALDFHRAQVLTDRAGDGDFSSRKVPPRPIIRG
jgi:hypothetical protein